MNSLKNQKMGKNIRPLIIAFVLLLVSLYSGPVLAAPQGESWPAVGSLLSVTPCSECTYTTWKTSNTDRTFISSTLDPSNWWYSDLGNITNWSWGDTFITKLDFLSESSDANHAGFYAVTSKIIQDDGGYTVFPESTLRPIPIPQVVDTRESGEVDLSWSAGQSAGDADLITGYLLYSFKTTDENYQPTDNDTWNQVDELITETSRTLTGLDSENTYYFALRIVYPDGFSTTHISGNSAAVRVNPPAPLIPDVPELSLFIEPINDPPADEPSANDPQPSDPSVESQINPDLGGGTFPGLGGCGADGHLGFGFLPLFGIFFLKRKN
ncbi:MAG: fibronectin type III domain-containing protein [bacterium]|nr:fibronectin type III domain-containing protein [bacterium]